MRDEVLKYKQFSRRALIIGGIKLLLFSAIVGRYYNLQLMASSKFTTLSDKNRLKIIILAPPRGVIYDCNREVVATNSLNFRIGVDSFAIHNINEVVNKISNVLGNELVVNNEELKRKLQKKSINSYLYLKDNLKWPEVSKLIESDHLIPGVEVVESSHRSYSFPEAFAHITGYVSTPNKLEVEKLQMQVPEEMKIGKIGVERIFDAKLRGSPGFKKTEVDVKGKLIRILDADPPISGEELVLTINSKLQNFIHYLLTTMELTASAVVLDVTNGNVLAMHSTPSYDPNLFVDGISRQDWDNITSRASNPLINHAISSAYPPGSNFKLVTALAGLMAGFNPHTHYYCPGEFRLGSRIIKCWNHSGHGNIDLFTAIPQSCNPYFFNMALKMGIDKLYKGAKILGVGERSGIELFGEIEGLMPNPEWKKQKLKVDWYSGDTVNTSIGQGFMLMTPLQIAVMTARIASGRNIVPSLVLNDLVAEPLDVDPKIFDIIRTGMFDCVNSPKGVLYNRRLFINDFKICGKTGTAQVVALKYKDLGHNFKDHGLFTSFGPYENPKYSVTLVVEHGGSGSKVAPIVKEIYSFMVENNII